ncbi:MAG: hypothetical protein LW817_01990 [Candidatus Caenarcaniphilales bacterium]|jgi:hypothetical protein|nr:hypothetical protein [Candidatus Caenarcaniphilales bacterium]
MIETKTRKKTGPKPLYGEAKKMVSFRLSPEALTIIKNLADKDSLSQAEVLERWARQYRTGGDEDFGQDLTENRQLIGAQRN